MKRLATAARAAIARPSATKPVRARFADALRIPACYPAETRSMPLH